MARTNASWSDTNPAQKGWRRPTANRFLQDLNLLHLQRPCRMLLLSRARRTYQAQYGYRQQPGRRRPYPCPCPCRLELQGTRSPRQALYSRRQQLGFRCRLKMCQKPRPAPVIRMIGALPVISAGSTHSQLALEAQPTGKEGHPPWRRYWRRAILDGGLSRPHRAPRHGTGGLGALRLARRCQDCSAARGGHKVLAGQG